MGDIRGNFFRRGRDGKCGESADWKFSDDSGHLLRAVRKTSVSGFAKRDPHQRPNWNCFIAAIPLKAAASYRQQKHWRRPRMHAGRRGFARRRRLRFVCAKAAVSAFRRSGS